MVEVVSLGSINVDRTQYLADDEIAELAATYDWFPGPGETRSIDEPPAAVTDQSYENFLGGKAANQAVAAARAGADTALLGKVGRDAAEYDVRETLRRRGVNVEYVAPSNEPTGKAYIWVAERGDSHIAIVAGANADVDEHYILDHEAVIREASVLLVQNEIPAAGILALFDQLADTPDRPTVIVDPAPVTGAEPLVEHGVVDIVSPNATEYEALEDRLLDGEKTVVKRQGADDIVVCDGGTERFRVTPPPVDAVDATGAGDVFNGYLGSGLAAGATLEDAVAQATCAASMSVELAGAQQAIPTTDEVTAFRQS
ncbi:MAG: PfkB family carbohydrate kinase [Halobacteriaceae archaeon]